MPEATDNKGFFVAAIERGAILRYGLAPTLVALGLAVRVLLSSILPNEAIFLYFMPAVLVSAGIGGLGPGLLATALSVAAVLMRLGDPMPAVGIRPGQRHCLYDSCRSACPGAASCCTAARRRGEYPDRRRAGARGASAIDSRHRTGGHDRHRRPGRHPIVQQRRGTAIRLQRRRGASAQRPAS